MALFFPTSFSASLIDGIHQRIHRLDFIFILDSPQQNLPMS